MRIAIIDDTEADREHLSRLIGQCISEHALPACHIIAFESGKAFLQDFYQETYDLIFLDIYMDGADGIETAKKIRETDKNVKLVFVTVSNDFASESYAVSASYYLRKPVGEPEIRQMLSRLHLHGHSGEKMVTLPNGQPLLLHSIVYTSFSGHYVTIYLISGEQLRVRCTQREWEKLLLAFPDFILCTKGVIVNLEEVEKLDASLFIMKNNVYIPISRRKYPEVKQTYSDFLIRKTRSSFPSRANNI